MTFTRIAAALSMLCAGSVWAQTNYTIRITEPSHHLADIEMQLEQHKAGVVEVKMPAWRTGKYEIMDLANGVRRFVVKDETGKELPVQKSEKSTWQVKLDKPTRLTVSYQVYANALGGRSRHIDETHAYIDASAYLMFTEQSRAEEALVSLQVPKEWRSTSGMPRLGAHQFKAANYDVLIDSPIETGIHQSFTFKADGRDYELVIWGEGNYDSQQMVTDLQKLVQQTDSIWQGYPYQNYLFIVHATDGVRGATEHLNSTVIQRDRFTFKKREHYVDFLATASHELVHTWNVKAYRPSEMVPYDFLNPNYTKLLWISEGSTSYFQDQLLLRAGLMTHEEFYADIAKALDKFSRLPGAQVQSVAESSFDNWISLPGDHADNFSVNIYSEGYLVSWMLDKWLLDNSGLKANYRTLHNELYQRFGKTTAFTADDVKTIAKDLTGDSLEPFWQAQVETPMELDSKALLAAAGLELVYPKGQKAFTGISSSNKEGPEKVSKVLRDSPAWQAGFTSDDEIIAINGLKLKAPLEERLKDFKPNDKIRVSLFRSGRLVELELTLGAVPDGQPKVQPVAKPSKTQQAFHKAWLGVDLPKPAK